MLEGLLREVAIVVIIISGVPLVCSSIAGLCVAALQTATQIQEQTITYLVKFASVCIVFAFFSGWFFSHVVSFTRRLLASIAVIGVGAL